MIEETEALPFAADDEGNFESHILNALESAWDAYEEEEIGEEEVSSVLDFVESLVEDQIKGLESSASSGQISALEASRVAVLGGFYQHLTAIDLMRRFFKEQQDDLIDEGLELIQQATNKIVEACYEEASAPPPKLCLYCQEPNERSAARCVKCSKVLPVAVENFVAQTLLATEGEALPDGQDETTEEFIIVSDALERWRQDEIDDKECLQALSKAHDLLRSDLQGLSDTDSEAVREGIKRSLASLEQLINLVREADTAEAIDGAMEGFALATIDLMKQEDFSMQTKAAGVGES